MKKDNNNPKSQKNSYDFINKNNARRRSINQNNYNNQYDYYDDDYYEYDDVQNRQNDYNDYDDYDDYDDQEPSKKSIEIYPVKAKKRQYQPQPKQKKRHPVRKFFIVMFSLLFVYVAVFGGYLLYNNMKGDGKTNLLEDVGLSNVLSNKVPDKTTVLITGVDEGEERDGTRTDTIMVGCFDSVNKKLSIISIPRDTRVQVDDDMFEVMKQNIPQLTSNKMKINAIHNYGGEQHGMEFLERELEELLGVEIDYYAKVNFEGFRYLIDSIGGVTFNVEQRCYYNDKAGLIIDLQPGEQLLDGDKAEQLVRFRKGYAMQDLKRIEVQRNFLKAFLSQALQKDKIMSNPSAYLETITQYVETDISIADALGYIDALNGFSGNNIKGYTLPGETSSNGGSYYIADDTEIKKMIDEIYNNKTSSTENSESNSSETSDSSSVSSVGKDIFILNGGYTSGLAKRAKTLLEKNGFTVSGISDANSKIQTTTIYTTKSGQGEDLKKYFTSATIEVNPSLCKANGGEILVILGSKEKLTEE